MTLADLSEEEYDKLLNIVRDLDELSSKSATDGIDMAEMVGLQIGLDVYKNLLGVEEMSNEDFYNFIGYEPKEEETNDTDDQIVFDLSDLSGEDIDILLSITERLQDYQYRLEKDSSDISGDELAEIVGLQVALDVYKVLLGKEFMTNKEFIEFIDLKGPEPDIPFEEEEEEYEAYKVTDLTVDYGVYMAITIDIEEDE